MIVKVGHGHDSHRFSEGYDKPLILGGVKFDEELSLMGNSDADVILHAITDAISSVTGITVIGDRADQMCEEGITDSKVYLAKALEYLDQYSISHVSITIECLKPRIDPLVQKIKKSLSLLLNLPIKDIGITATSGEGLTEYGKGLGIYSTAILTFIAS